MKQVVMDAYAPAQMAARVEKVGIVKGNLDIVSTFTLAVLAGAFIAFGAVLFTFVIHDSSLSLGLTKLLGGLVFCLGLILVIVAGAELFTGNNLIVMAYVSKKLTLGQLLRNWGVVFAGNFVGSLGVVLLIMAQWALGVVRIGRWCQGAYDCQCQSQPFIRRGVYQGNALQCTGLSCSLALL